MTPSFDKLKQILRKLPGLGPRSAERIALHLLVEKPELSGILGDAIREAATSIARCERCGNICEHVDGAPDLCEICSDPARDGRCVCIVEQVPDLMAMEKSGAFRGVYHVLHGKLSPVQGIGPNGLNMAALARRIREGGISELILALSNDIEAEATCHYIQDQIVGDRDVRVSRIGFGLPSGAGIGYADSTTLRSALESRRNLG